MSLSEIQEGAGLRLCPACPAHDFLEVSLAIVSLSNILRTFNVTWFSYYTIFNSCIAFYCGKICSFILQLSLGSFSIF